MASSCSDSQNNDENRQEHSNVSNPSTPHPPFPIQDPTVSTELHKGLGNLYNNGLLTDVVLKVGKQRFPCHRNVLASVSPYFFAMFTNGLAESNQKEIDITGIDAEILKLILSYIYTGEVVITVEEAERVIVAANMLQMSSLVEHCGDFVSELLSPGNCVGMWIFADIHNCSNLKDYARQCIDYKFDIVCKEEEFANMDKDRLIEIILSNTLFVEHEKIVFEAVMNWIKHDIPERKQHLADMLQHVRLVLLPPDYLFDRVEQEDLLMTSPECVQYLDRVKQFHILKDRRPQLNLNTTPRAAVRKSGEKVERIPTQEETNMESAALEQIKQIGKNKGYTRLHKRVIPIFTQYKHPISNTERRKCVYKALYELLTYGLRRAPPGFIFIYSEDIKRVIRDTYPGGRDMELGHGNLKHRPTVKVDVEDLFDDKA